VGTLNQDIAVKSCRKWGKTKEKKEWSETRYMGIVLSLKHVETGIEMVQLKKKKEMGRGILPAMYLGKLLVNPGGGVQGIKKIKVRSRADIL